MKFKQADSFIILELKQTLFRRTLLLVIALLLPMPCSLIFGAPPLDAIQRCKQATVMVDAGDAGTGSAFCVREDGLFITNAHVVNEFLLNEIITLHRVSLTGKTESIKTRVISIDADNDLALLRSLEQLKHKTIELGDIDEVVETMTVTGFGYPYGRSLSIEGQDIPSVSLNVARISAIRRVEGEIRALQLDGAINPGHSGGPILNEEGKLIGVIVSGIRGSNISLAIPVNSLREFLSRPGMTIDLPNLNYSQRFKKIDLKVSVYPFSKRDKIKEVEFQMPSEGIIPRVISARLKGEHFVCETTILPPVDKEETVHVVATIGENVYHTEVVPQAIELSGKVMSLLDIRVIEKRADTHIVTLNSGKKLAGELESWEPFASDELTAGRVAGADRIDCFAAGHIIQTVSFNIAVRTSSGAESTRSFEVLFDNIPTSSSDDFNTEIAGAEGVAPGLKAIKTTLMQKRLDHEASIKKWLDSQGKESTKWQVLPIDTLQCTGSPTVSLQPGGGVLLTGKKPNSAVYNISTTPPVELSKVTGIMLKTLPHKSLPSGGPGRADGGRAGVREFEAYFYKDGKRIPIKFSRVCKNTLDRSYPSTNFNMSHLIDGNFKPYWKFAAKPLKEHEAVFVISEESRQQMTGPQLKIAIKNFFYAHLGHLRLYVTTDPISPMPPDSVGEINERIKEYQRGERFSYDPHFVDYVNGGVKPFRELLQQLKNHSETSPGQRDALNRNLNAKLARLPDLYAKELDEVEIELILRGRTKLEIHSQGFVLTRESGGRPGLVDDGAYYAKVNGQIWKFDWYDQDTTEPYYVNLGYGEWKLELDPQNSTYPAVMKQTDAHLPYVQFDKPNSSKSVQLKFRLVKQNLVRPKTETKKESPPVSHFSPSDLIADTDVKNDQLNQLMRKKNGADVEVSARYPQGYLVGPVPIGMTLTLQYRSGVWTTSPDIPPASPEKFSEMNKLDSRLAIAAVSKVTGETHILDIINEPTQKTPYTWTSDKNYDRIVLRIVDNSAGKRFTTKEDKVLYQLVISK